MAKWHLMNPMAVSERTCEAESEFWAKRKFAPIPKGWFVASDCSYAIGWREVKPELLTVCSKCNRHPAVEGRNQCEACAAHKRKAYRKHHGLDELAPVKEPKARERGQAVRRKRENLGWKQNVMQSNTLRGIRHRAAKRDIQMRLAL